ncbi:MAG: chemotaxis protein CheW [Nitrospira sp.]|nr:chemotaxis protein CheW [Nitrospira sp.]
METSIDKPSEPRAGSRSDLAKSAHPRRVCLLPVSRECLAVELGSLCEVITVKEMTTVPGMPLVLAGVTTCRGAVIPLVDLRVLLDWPRTLMPRYAAVVRQGEVRFGILIDDVPEIQTVQRGDVPEESYGESSNDRPFFADFVNLPGRKCARLDLSALLATIESLPTRSAIGGG